MYRMTTWTGIQCFTSIYACTQNDNLDRNSVLYMSLHLCCTQDDNLDKYWNPKLYIENAIGEPQTRVDHLTSRSESGNVFIVETKRFRGTFVETMELWNFPFDIQVC